MSPRSVSATTVGRIRLPRSVGTTFGMRARTWATQALVVPRSMPMMDFSRGSAMTPDPCSTPPRHPRANRRAGPYPVHGAALEGDILVVAGLPLRPGGSGLLQRLAEERREDPRI